MGNFYDEIPDKQLEWIARQKMFWVATAALNGHVNLSPKGYIESFHILNKNRVWYEDMTGSGESPHPPPLLTYILPLSGTFGSDTALLGVETIAHMREPGNARVTIMFHAFDGAPRILRIWGTGTYALYCVPQTADVGPTSNDANPGTVHEFGTPEYDALIPPASRKAGSRAAIVIDVHKVATVSTPCAFTHTQVADPRSNPAQSCGFGIPQYRFMGQRSQLERWCDELERTEAQVSPTEKAPNGIKAWWTAENTRSFDGLPALEKAHNTPLAVRSSYDRNAPRPPAQADPVATSAPPSVKYFDGRLLVAFSLGVATTLVAIRLASLRVH